MSIVNMLDNIGGDLRVMTEMDLPLVRGWSVAGDEDVLKAVHAKNEQLRADCKDRFLKRYA